MSLSIVIAHYTPREQLDKYVRLLKDNIDNLREQVIDTEIEIILCDDGSYWSKDLFTTTNESEIVVMEKDSIKTSEIFDQMAIDKYYGLCDVNRYRGVLLKDFAIRNARFAKILILDDDHIFQSKHSLYKISTYLDKYEYVKGRVIGPDGIPQLYLSKNAQGTTYAMQKSLYLESGGFSRYLHDNGYGEDNDILYRIYKVITNNEKYKGCFAGDVVTKDLASNRWAGRAETDKKLYEQQLQIAKDRKITFIEDFIKMFGVHPFKNKSRIRYTWLSIPSIHTYYYELVYTFIYLLYLPITIYKLINNKYLK
jgi:hypothetical protein